MKVRVIRECFVDNGLRKKGDTFDYNGPPNRHLERADGKSWTYKEAPEGSEFDDDDFA